jgi:hypothetical protein
VRRTALVLAAIAVSAVLAGCSSSSDVPIRQSIDTSKFTPSAKNPDPSTDIKGVEVVKFPAGLHVGADVRVAYTHTPPIGGRHDQVWAACDGVVYPKAVRQENLVHDLEHGAVWIAYDPARITGSQVTALSNLVDGKPYMVMSPYPDMPSPISLQAWGHQLRVDDVTDPRIDQFIAALRQNPNTHPEPGASCGEVGAPYFQVSNPPPFVPTPKTSEVDGKTIVKEQG